MGGEIPSQANLEKLYPKVYADLLAGQEDLERVPVKERRDFDFFNSAFRIRGDVFQEIGGNKGKMEEFGKFSRLRVGVMLDTIRQLGDRNAVELAVLYGKRLKEFIFVVDSFSRDEEFSHKTGAHVMTRNECNERLNELKNTFHDYFGFDKDKVFKKIESGWREAYSKWMEGNI